MSVENYLRKVGLNIREARQKAGLTQLQVHERTGLTYRHYQNIEAGRVNVTLETLHRLSVVFAVQPQDLARGES